MSVKQRDAELNCYKFTMQKLECEVNKKSLFQLKGGNGLEIGGVGACDTVIKF